MQTGLGKVQTNTNEHNSGSLAIAVVRNRMTTDKFGTIGSIPYWSYIRGFREVVQIWELADNYQYSSFEPFERVLERLPDLSGTFQIVLQTIC